jgi:type IV fimbrial biogenesis protein FimT
MNNTLPTPRQKFLAFTLVEVLVVVSLIAILATIGVPSFREMIKNNRVTGQNNELIALVHFAKSEAIRRSTNVDVVLLTTAEGWEGGVPDPDGDADVDGCPEGLLRCALNRRVFLDIPSDPLTLTFNSRGYLANLTSPNTWDPAGRTFRLQHDSCTSDRQARRIDILPTGQVASVQVGCF